MLVKTPAKSISMTNMVFEEPRISTVYCVYILMCICKYIYIYIKTNLYNICVQRIPCSIAHPPAIHSDPQQNCTPVGASGVGSPASGFFHTKSDCMFVVTWCVCVCVWGVVAIYVYIYIYIYLYIQYIRINTRPNQTQPGLYTRCFDFTILGLASVCRRFDVLINCQYRMQKFNHL